MPGWIDSLLSPAGIIVATAKGVKRIENTNKNYKFTIIPVDSTIRAMLSIACDLKSRAFPTELPIYNLSLPEKGNQDLFRAENYCKFLLKLLEKSPLLPGIWCPNITFIENKFFYRLNLLLFQIIPAYLIDGLLMMFGQKTL